MSKVKINVLPSIGDSFIEVDGVRLKGVTGFGLQYDVSSKLPHLTVDIIVTELDVTAYGVVEINRKPVSMEEAVHMLKTLQEKLKLVEPPGSVQDE